MASTFYTINDIVDKAEGKLSRGLVRGLIGSGQLAHIKIGCKVLITAEEVDRLFTEGTKPIVTKNNNRGHLYEQKL
jgi:hypothetical protein